jgi:hypothetical protein
MSDKYEISFYNLKRLRYGIITEYKGWKFISIDNKSFTKKLNFIILNGNLIVLIKHILLI